jgi:putative two-component system response regulator
MSWSGDLGGRILVVDDEPAIRGLVRRLLERAGYDCRTAESPEEAERLLEDADFELLLADLQMPGGSGLELIARVRTRHPDTAAIMITGVDDPQLAEAALSLGAYGYIVKPFSPTELSIQVMNALRRRKLEIAQRNERQRLEQVVEARTAELRRAVTDLKRSEEETARRLAAAVEARDHETAAHIERVSAFSGLVARRLGLPEETCELIARASKLHDVGKIGVADGILLKPGPLTDSERRKMEDHARIGREMLAGSKLELLELAATIAWTHHERVDGTGYPRCLSGEDIPLAGRIVAVVDVYDALTSDRPYRDAMSREQALAVLRSGRGTQFDPDVLDAFLDALDDARELVAIHPPEVSV